MHELVELLQNHWLLRQCTAATMQDWTAALFSILCVGPVVMAVAVMAVSLSRLNKPSEAAAFTTGEPGGSRS